MLLFHIPYSTNCGFFSCICSFHIGVWCKLNVWPLQDQPPNACKTSHIQNACLRQEPGSPPAVIHITQLSVGGNPVNAFAVDVFATSKHLPDFSHGFQWRARGVSDSTLCSVPTDRTGWLTHRLQNPLNLPLFMVRWLLSGLSVNPNIELIIPHNLMHLHF